MYYFHIFFPSLLSVLFVRLFVCFFIPIIIAVATFCPLAVAHAVFAVVALISDVCAQCMRVSMCVCWQK